MGEITIVREEALLDLFPFLSLVSSIGMIVPAVKDSVKKDRSSATLATKGRKNIIS